MISPFLARRMYPFPIDMNRPLTLAFSAVLLAACAGPAPVEDTPASSLIAEPVPEIEEPAERPIPADSVYPLLLAEFALRRRAYDTALDTYLEQARLLEDAGVSKHTTHLAQFARNDELSLEAVQLWLALEPDDAEANNTAATLLTRQYRPLEAIPHMAVVARSGAQANFPTLLQGFKQLPSQEQAKLVEQINDLSQEFPQDPALLLTQALIHTEFEQFGQAQVKLDALFVVEPYQHQALLLEARIRMASESTEPFSHIEEALEVNPGDTRLRLEYARLLTSTDMKAARSQFEVLSAQNPQDADLLLSLALINREIGDDLAARAYLRQILELDERSDEANYYLGRIAEDRGDPGEAVSHYKQVSDSRQYMSANQRLGKIWLSTGQLKQSRAWFNAQRRAVPTRAEQLYNMEAELLSSAGKLDASLDVLNQGLDDFPDSTVLRYARSMIGDRQDNLALLESDLREILARDPNNATALNALGYTLADRTDRVDEAYALISRALELDPDEPAILDSMGWVLYRRGEYAKAIDYLTRAYALFPDPEVASHLGEALWAHGDKDRAVDILQGALLKAPQNALLMDTLQRLGVEDVDPDPLNRAGDIEQ